MELGYADADEFVTKLNACIQAARSVTWVLQKEAKHVDGFEKWYPEQQGLMRADARMRWLVEARNAIEKQGDLDTHSVAAVSLALTDQEVPIQHLEMPPLMSPQEAAAVINVAELPDRVRRQAVMVVERRWTVAELPEDELLDALGHCYGVLARVVSGAHEFLGIQMQTFGGETHEHRHTRVIHPSGRLPCMLPTAATRTAYWHLGRDSLITFEETEHRLGRTEMEKLPEETERRYGDIARTHRVLPGTPLVEQAATTHQIARRILTVDKFHTTLVWIYRGGVTVGQYRIESEDHAERVVQIRRVASEVEREGADAVIFVRAHETISAAVGLIS
jgi:hypothetical protein